MKKLATEAETGIIGDDSDLKRRVKFFGKNTKPLPQIPPLKESIKDALNDRILLSLAVCAFITICIGLYAHGWVYGWIEGAAIYFAIFIIVSIVSANDWMKDKQFVKLQSSVKDQDIPVIRGKYGATQSVNIYDLVVGDIILLETGARIPADCLLIDGQDLSIDESYYNQNEVRAVKKKVASEKNYYENPDPFLLSQSLIVSGVGRAVVCCVGPQSRRGIYEDKLDTSTKTPLQKKLENLAGIFTKAGLYAAILIFIASLVRQVMTVMATNRGVLDELTIEAFFRSITLTITLIIVAVPEGLPLTVGISLAYSVMRMKKDKVLVRNLNAPEVMGSVEEICTGKTNTLTKGDMRVTQFYAQSRLIRITRKNTLFNCELFDNMIQLLIESILFNSDARIEMDDKAFYVPVGNGTDVGMIKFLQDAEVAVHDIIKKKFGRIESIIPMSPDRKRQLIAVRHPDMDDIIRIYVKGAPEKIIDKCTKTYAVDGTRAHLDNDQLNYIKNDIISQHFTSKGYRAIMFAYKDLNIDEFEKLKRQCNNFQTEQDREALEN